MVGTIPHFKDLVEVLRIHGIREMIHYDICVTSNLYDGIFKNMGLVRGIQGNIRIYYWEQNDLSYDYSEDEHNRSYRKAEKDYETLEKITETATGFVKLKTRQMQGILIGYCSSEFRTKKNPLDPLIQFRELEGRLRNFQL